MRNGELLQILMLPGGFPIQLLKRAPVSSQEPVSANNCLLAELSAKDREQLLAQCEQVELNFSDILYCAGEIIPYVYFPIESFISLLTPIEGSTSLEVGLVGNEGMLGITLILNVDTAPFHALVQGAGSALRISAPLFLRELERNSGLQRKLKRYLYVCLCQLAHTATCNRFHVVEARLARWLLMTQDRAHSNHFHVTHLFLAYILGVRRVGVTKAANALKKRQLISYHRGDITILNRAGLEAASCDCYRADKESYENFLG